MAALLALAPILLILGLMVGLRWPAAMAGLVGLAATLAVALLGFGYGQATYPELGPALAVGGTFAEALFVAATILWIIFPALCIYELQLHGGAFEVLKAALARLSDDPRILAVLVAWFFALFLEGAAGFGTPVALAAPILVSLGFAPVPAITLVLIGHAAGVSFGAVGTPILPQIAVTGFTGPELARATGLLHGLLGWILLVFVFRIAGREAESPGGWRNWGYAGAAAGCFLLPFLALSQLVGPELPTLGGALVGGLAFVGLLRWWHGERAGGTVGSGWRLLRAALPYLVLLLLILVTRLVPPLQAELQNLEWAWSLAGSFSGSIQPLYHPGTLLLLGFLIGGRLQGRHPRELWAAAVRAGRRLPPVLLALAAMLALARLMVHAGMIAALAETAADTFGPVWPWLAPAVGVLGTFVTGSATTSNILLTDFQGATAARLTLPELWLVAAQGFGAAVGNIVCPHNIIAGGATVGLQGREGEVLRRTTLACAAYALAGGALVYVLVA
ncbi:MAG TPA: L-lactate permease [Arenibaculum sp.]|nr:L-lactate permease [Arenibaculum sp.]